LHPQGLAPRIVNLTEWRAHLLARLRRQIETAADTTLADLLKELNSYPEPSKRNAPASSDYAGIAIPLQLKSEYGVLSFLSMTTVFGTPLDITLSELALESFFPADAATAAILSQLLQGDEPQIGMARE
jgi:hypothetical protein